nr:SDR family oxidoreductase [Micromonospora sp. DSM 115978]
MLDLHGRVALVTGAAAGIGRAVATSLAACGARLALCDRDADGLASTADALPKTAEPLTGVLDVRDATAVAAFVDRVSTWFGRLDVLVNNAGGGFVANFLDVTPRGQQALVDENFTSVTLFVRSCVPLMTDGGSIVNVTSVEAFRAAPGFGVYAAMKAAVENLSRTLALELAPRRIRVNCLAPDAVRT